MKLVYVVDQDEVEGMSAGDHLVFTRTITATGAGSYRVNNKEVSWADYDAQLKEIGVLTKARNFLVFQGDVEHLAFESEYNDEFHART